MRKIGLLGLFALLAYTSAIGQHLVLNPIGIATSGKEWYSHTSVGYRWDEKINADLSIGYARRFGSREVQEKISPNLYHQYHERINWLTLEGRKYFRVNIVSAKPELFYAFAGGVGVMRWGSYRGVADGPGLVFSAMPQVGVSLLNDGMWRPAISILRPTRSLIPNGEVMVMLSMDVVLP